MLLGRVVGTIVATRKDPRLEGKKLLIVKPIDAATGKDEGSSVVSVDTVQAGFKDRVLLVAGSSARNASGCKDCPVDSAIIGIVDHVELQ
jgi:microcompartment protein CcmK/EutM